MNDQGEFKSNGTSGGVLQNHGAVAVLRPGQAGVEGLKFGGWDHLDRIQTEALDCRFVKLSGSRIKHGIKPIYIPSCRTPA